MTTHVWMRRLCLFRLLCFLPALLRGRIRLVTADDSGLALRLCREVARRWPARLEIQVRDLRMAVATPEGHPLKYRTDPALARITARFLAPLRASDSWLPEAERPWHEPWCRVLGSNFLHRIRLDLLWVYCVENDYLLNRRRLAPGDRLAVVLDPIAPMAAVQESLDLRVGGTVGIRGHLPGRSALMFSLLPGAALLSGLRCLRAARGPRPAFHFPASGRGSNVEEYESHHLTTAGGAAALRWWDFTACDPGRMVFMFFRPDAGYSEDAARRMRERGFGYVDAARPERWLARPFADGLALMAECFARFVHAPSGMRLWTVTSMARYRVECAGLEAALRQAGVRVMHQRREFGPETQALILATRKAGGAALWHHWSFDRYFTAWHTLGFCDVLLLWGGLSDGFFAAHGFPARARFLTGMLGVDGPTDAVRARAGEIRAALPPSVRFVVTLFDTSYSRHTQVSADDVADFYGHFLAQLERHPDWGLVVKPKGDSYDRLPVRPGLQDAMARLEAEGRAVRLDGRDDPSAAALAGDVVVCYEIGSAGIAAAVSGCRTLHYDGAGNVHHPLYRLSGGAGVVYNRLPDLSGALELAAAQEGRMVGDHTPFLRLCDAYLDGRGAERYGWIVARILDGEGDMDRILDGTILEYRRLWGDGGARQAPPPATEAGAAQWQETLRRLGVAPGEW